jgi:hypothetical protein
MQTNNDPNTNSPWFTPHQNRYRGERHRADAPAAPNELGSYPPLHGSGSSAPSYEHRSHDIPMSDSRSPSDASPADLSPYAANQSPPSNEHHSMGGQMHPHYNPYQAPSNGYPTESYPPRDTQQTQYPSHQAYPGVHSNHYNPNRPPLEFAYPYHQEDEAAANRHHRSVHGPNVPSQHHPYYPPGQTQPPPQHNYQVHAREQPHRPPTGPGNPYDLYATYRHHYHAGTHPIEPSRLQAHSVGPRHFHQERRDLYGYCYGGVPPYAPQVRGLHTFPPRSTFHFSDQHLVQTHGDVRSSMGSAEPESAYTDSQRFSFSNSLNRASTHHVEGGLTPSPPTIPPPPRTQGKETAAERSNPDSKPSSGEGPLRDRQNTHDSTSLNGSSKDKSLLAVPQKQDNAAKILMQFQTKPPYSGGPTTIPNQPSMSESERTISSVAEPIAVPPHHPRRLILPCDRSILNALHCFVREELLEVFVVEDTAKNGSMVGHVGMRCVYCAQVRERTGQIDPKEAPMAIFYPKAVSEIYRLVTSWQRCHVRRCHNIPPALRKKWEKLRTTEKSRGKTAHWTDSAHDIGLTNISSRAGGIRFLPPDTVDDQEKSVGMTVETAAVTPAPSSEEPTDRTVATL